AHVSGRIGRDDQMGVLRALFGVVRLQDYARVERIRFALGYGYGIDVHFRYLREIDDEIGEADDDLLELPEIDRLLPPDAPEHLVDAGLLHHQSREGLVK